VGKGIVAVECLDDEFGIVRREGEDYFALVLKAYLATSRGRAGRVGAAAGELIDAADIVEFGARWMERNL
jgi:aminoglycoside N3'-acetyltransferase